MRKNDNFQSIRMVWLIVPYLGGSIYSQILTQRKVLFFFCVRRSNTKRKLRILQLPSETKAKKLGIIIGCTQAASPYRKKQSNISGIRQRFRFCHKNRLSGDSVCGLRAVGPQQPWVGSTMAKGLDKLPLQEWGGETREGRGERGQTLLTHRRDWGVRTPNAPLGSN